MESYMPIIQKPNMETVAVVSGAIGFLLFYALIFDIVMSRLLGI